MPRAPLPDHINAKIREAYKSALNGGGAPYRTACNTGAGQRSAVNLAAEQLFRNEGETYRRWQDRLQRYVSRLSEADLAELHGVSLHPQTAAGLIHPEIPSGSLPPNELVEHLTKRFDRERRQKTAKSWRKIHVRLPGPFGVAFLGDPHMDNHGCNWPLLRRDVDIIKRTEGMFAANAGDSIDNWVGRLMKLKGANAVTDSDAYMLCKWLVDELEGKWAMFVLGNHDTWNDGAEIFRHVCKNVVECDDWEAKVVLVAENGAEFPVWLAHSFKGNSIYNKVHGALRQARFSGAACLYIQGHHHEWAILKEEDADKGIVHTVGKARGYKFLDQFAVVHGFAEQQEGAAITAIFDPNASSAGAAVTCYSDLEEAAEFLTWKRERFLAAA